MVKIITSDPKVIWLSKCILGEGIHWVKEHNSIYFVDIKKKNIYRLNIKNKSKKVFKINKEIGFIVHINFNNFVLGLQDELRIINLKKNKIIKSIPIEKNIKKNRINDGKTDLQGRLWFGTMDNLERKIQKGTLYCLDKYFKLREVDKNYMITNGPAFITNNVFYHTDSKKGTIYKIKINKNYKIISKKIFIKFNKENGVPDGMTLDSRKNLWVCHYRGSCISVFNKSGKKIHSINFPVKNITNCTFGGYKNSELFVTTAKKGLKKKDMSANSLSGSLFKVQTNVTGSNTKKFNISL